MSKLPSNVPSQVLSLETDSEEGALAASVGALADLTLSGPTTVDTMGLPSGRSIQVEPRPEGDRLVVVGKGGRVELTVLLTEHGPRLVFESSELELHATRRVSVVCDDFEVHARNRASIHAARVDVRAEKGDVDVMANDNVVLVGEQVRLNCDAPDEIPPWMQKSLNARLVPVPEANVFLPTREGIDRVSQREADGGARCRARKATE